MKANYWKIVEIAVDQGVTFGLNRAFKHTDKPTLEQLQGNIEREVMNSMCEYFDFLEKPEAQ